MTAEENARLSHKIGHSCASAVFAAFADQMGITNEEAERLAPAPRSEGGKCGAFLAGRKVLEQLMPEQVDTYVSRFEALNCSTICAVLVASHSRLHKKCNDYVGDAARICQEILSGR